MVSTLVLICISLMTNDVEILSHAITAFVFLLLWSVCSGLFLFLTELFVSFLLSLKNSLYIFYISPLSEVSLIKKMDDVVFQMVAYQTYFGYLLKLV